jgi:hypothetical protein
MVILIPASDCQQELLAPFELDQSESKDTDLCNGYRRGIILHDVKRRSKRLSLST